MKKILGVLVVTVILIGCTKQSDVIVTDDGSSKMSLYAECQTFIQGSLKNPRSFDSDIATLKRVTKENGNKLIGFDFYAANSFGGEQIYEAFCEFDKEGRIVSSAYR